MNVDQYFKQAQDLAKLCGKDGYSLARTLSYDFENEQPAQWIPAAQKELLTLIKILKNEDILGQAITLYAEGERLQNSKNLQVNLFFIFSSLFIGILIGLLF
jgi:hypothetical protein